MRESAALRGLTPEEQTTLEQLARSRTAQARLVDRVYAILDNLHAHRATDVLLFALAHPRWEFVFQPKYAAYLNLIEPWWKVLKSLALKGRRFESWQEVCEAVEKATAYWNGHRHPFVWGRRRRHRPRRPPGIAAVPGVRRLAG
jgi:transposase